MTGRRGRMVALAVSAMCAGPVVRAQPAPPDDTPAETKPDKAAARAHFERARKLHDRGQYHEAAAAYLEAYQHFAAPAFLYNAGQVYRLAGEHELALEHYRRYLELAPDGEAAADARQFIAELETSKPAEAQPDSPAVEPDPRSAIETPPSEPAQPEPSIHRVVIDPQPPTADPSDGSNLRISGLIVAGVGVASLAVGAGFAARASSIHESLNGHTGPWTAELDDEYQAGESAERYATISFVAGGAALATGAVLYWVGRRRGLERGQPLVQLAPTVDGASAWMTVRY